MSEHRTITFPKTTPLIERISEASKAISEWLKSLEEPFNVNRDTMQLVKYERNDKYSYHYIIDRAVKDPDKRSAARESRGADADAK